MVHYGSDSAIGFHKSMIYKRTSFIATDSEGIVPHAYDPGYINHFYNNQKRWGIYINQGLYCKDGSSAGGPCWFYQNPAEGVTSGNPHQIMVADIIPITVASCRM